MSDQATGPAFSAAVWVENSEARIFCFRAGRLDKQHVSSGKGDAPRQSGSGSGDVDLYMRAIVAKFADAEKILILGPDSAKSRLEVYLREHEPVISARVVAVESSNTATDGQIVARARARLSRP